MLDGVVLISSQGLLLHATEFTPNYGLPNCTEPFALATLLILLRQQAEQGDNTLIQELQALFSAPYDTPANDLASRYDQLRPREFFRAGGISHYSCSS